MGQEVARAFSFSVLEAGAQITSIIFLSLGFLGVLVAAKGVQKTERKVFPRAQKIMSQDIWISVDLIALFALMLFVFATSSYQLFKDERVVFLLPFGWLLSTVLSFEVLRRLLSRLFRFSDTRFLLMQSLRVFAKELKRGDEAKALEWVDIYIEVIQKEASKGNLSSVQDGLKALQGLLDIYIQVMSQNEVNTPVNTPFGTSVLERFNVLSVYVCKRLEWVFTKAIFAQMAPVLEEIIVAYGKMGLFCLYRHPSLAKMPLSYISRSAKIALDANEQDAVVRAIVTLSEACKACIQSSKDEQLISLVLSLILDLEVCVKDQYKRNKEISPALLMQPFAEIGQTLGEEHNLSFPGRDSIMKELKRILAEFQSLEVVMQNVNVTAENTDSTAAFKEDMPYMH